MNERYPSSHADIRSVAPLKIPLIVIANKYDVFGELESMKRKVYYSRGRLRGSDFLSKRVLLSVVLLTFTQTSLEGINASITLYLSLLWRDFDLCLSKR